MVIVCPACGARYAPPQNAVPAAGRMVRCSACRAEWRATPGGEPSGPSQSRPATPAAPAPVAVAGPTGTAPSTMAASLDPSASDEPGGRGGFMAGFSVVALLALGGLALYLNHQAVADAAPALAGPLEAYVALVDDLRQRLAGLAGGF